MQRFTELVVWQKGHALALKLYRLSKTFPSDERFGLTSQLKRAVVSVPTNVAEGSKCRSRKDYARYLNIAEGSITEVEYLLMLAGDLGYLEPSSVRETVDDASEIARMLYSLRTKVERTA